MQDDELAEYREQRKRHLREREEYVSVVAQLFMAGKVSATLIGDRLTKWELVEVLAQVGAAKVEVSA